MQSLMRHSHKGKEVTITLCQIKHLKPKEEVWGHNTRERSRSEEITNIARAHTLGLQGCKTTNLDNITLQAIQILVLLSVGHQYC